MYIQGVYLTGYIQQVQLHYTAVLQNFMVVHGLQQKSRPLFGFADL